MAASNQKLSDRDFLIDPVNEDFIHCVKKSDTTDSPEGSSKKLTWATIKDTLFSFLKQRDVYESTYSGRLGQVATVALDSSSGNLGMKFQSMPTYTDIVGGNAIITGGISNIIGTLSYRVWASKFIVNNVVYTNYISDTVTLNNGDATNARFDSIVVEVDSSDPPNVTIDVVEGTPAANPLKPTINLQNQVELSFVDIPALATSDGNATLEPIYNENTGEPNEWDNIALQIGGDLAYTVDPFIGTLCTKFDPIVGGTTSWQKDSMHAFNIEESLVFAMKSETITEQNTQINIELNNSVDGHYYNINLVLDNLINYGFNSNVLDWQVLTIPLSDFGSQFSPIEYDIIKFKFSNAPILYLDYIGIQGGSVTVDQPGLPVLEAPIDGNTYARKDAGWVAAGSSVLESKTGTTIEFTSEAVYNEAAFLESGDLTLDLTGAVKGVVCLVYCLKYIPTIIGNYFLGSGLAYGDTLNILSFFYDGVEVYLNILNVDILAAPTLLIVDGDTELTVSWDAIFNAESYIVERAEDSGFTVGLTEVYNGNLFTFVDTGLTNGVTYYYRCRCTGNGFLDSENGATETGTPSVGVDYLSGLVAAYQWESNLLDFTTNSHDGTAVGSVGFGTGQVNLGMVIDGTNDYMSIPDNEDFSFGSNPFSFGLWLKIDSFPTATQGIISKRSGTNGDKEFSLNYSNTTDLLTCLIYTDDSNYIIGQYSVDLTLGGWNHFVVTSSGSDLKMYVNKVLVETGTEVGTYTGIPNTSNAIGVGADIPNLEVTAIDGVLDELKIYKNRELSASVIGSMYDSELLGISVL